MHPEKRPNPDRFAELEARLRALPLPPLPPDLEARLLVNIPAARPSPWRRWSLVGAIGALAAACLLAVLAWHGRDGKSPVPLRENNDPAHAHGPGLPRSPAGDPSAGRGSADSIGADHLAARLQARRALEEAESPLFNWPLETTASHRTPTTISHDLLD
jgi:hypothetical protein